MFITPSSLQKPSHGNYATFPQGGKLGWRWEVWDGAPYPIPAPPLPLKGRENFPASISNSRGKPMLRLNINNVLLGVAILGSISFTVPAQAAMPCTELARLKIPASEIGLKSGG